MRPSVGGPPLVLPRGPHGLPRDVVQGSQRRRIVVATARLVAEHGYASTRVVDIAKLAGVSQTTFYEQFKDKEELFLACYQAGSDPQHARVYAALTRPAHPREQARDALIAYLNMLEADEDFAQAFFIEAEIATPRIRAQFLANQNSYTDLIDEWHKKARANHPRLPAVSRPVWAGVTAGIAGLCTQHIRRNGAAGVLQQVCEPALDLVLAVAGLRTNDPGRHKTRSRPAGTTVN